MRNRLKTSFLLALLATAGWGSLAHAADKLPVDVRVDRLEKELRAVQRKVFPGGMPVEPEITAAPAPAPEAVPTSTPITDLLARVTTLETQMATMTGQIEQNSYRLRQLEDRIKTMEAAQSAQAAPAEGEIAGAPDMAGPVVANARPAPATRPIPTAPAPAKTPLPVAKPKQASDARKTAVAAIERPSTGDAANDAYIYGYRLWEAKFYPEAQSQLKATVEKYGTTSVASRAQNLLGRAYLDDGKPALASVAFYENYQKHPDGDRTAQSLVYLGEALIQLKKPADACKVYKELDGSYGAGLTSSLRTMVEKGRVRAKCGA